MSVTEYERNHLFARFEELMGKERAATLMNLLPPVGWGDMATKRDLDALDTKIDRVAERLEAKIDTLAVTTRADLAELKSDLQRTFVTWMFAAQGAVVAAIGLLLVVVR